MRTKMWSPAVQTALLLLVLLGCKKTETVDPVALPSAVGNWKITALTFDPVWAAPSGANTIPVSDWVPYLKGNKETCLTDVTLTFGTNGSATTNAASTATCTSANDSRGFLDFLFEPGGTFAETDNQLTLYGKDKLRALTLTKSVAGNTMNIAFQDNVDFSNRPIKTTYTLKLVRQ
ncbi:hypothetical protein [uncultured Fibrella sp.]|uniref:hypothetical protein n=1 Tax=uncultured Fibrella sp. TaxID=1284596 RepID=UPI0035CC9368